MEVGWEERKFIRRGQVSEKRKGPRVQEGLPGFGDVGADIEGWGGDFEAGLLREADVLGLGAQGWEEHSI